MQRPIIDLNLIYSFSDLIEKNIFSLDSYKNLLITSKIVDEINSTENGLIGDEFIVDTFPKTDNESLGKYLRIFLEKNSPDYLESILTSALEIVSDWLPPNTKICEEIHFAFLNDELGGVGIKNVLINAKYFMSENEKKKIEILAHEIHHTSFYSVETLNRIKTKDYKFILNRMLLSEGISSYISKKTMPVKKISLYTMVEVLKPYLNEDYSDYEQLFKYICTEFGMHSFSSSLIQFLVENKGKNYVIDLTGRYESTLDEFIPLATKSLT